MKNFFLISLIFLFISCSSEQKSISIEGAWEWIQTINYKNNIPQDTVPRFTFKGKKVGGKFLKFFVDDHLIWIGRRNAGDSTAKGNVDKGAALLAKYSLKNDTLTEFLYRGTDGTDNFINKNGGIGSKYVAKINMIDENTFIQRKIGSPDARGELWVRSSSGDDKFNLNGAYTTSGKHYFYKNNILSDSTIYSQENRTTFGDRLFVSDYEILLYNRVNLDSDGKDRFPGVAYVAKLDKINDSIFSQNFIVNTSNQDKNLSRRIRQNKHIRMFKRRNNNMIVSHPESNLDSGNLRLVYFNKLNK
mgnify:FL=1